MHILELRARALVVGAALVVVTTLPSGCSSEGEPPAATPDRHTFAASPRIVFQQDGGARFEVALVRQDGSGRVAPLAALGDGHQTNPDWSPDGERLVFAMNDGERDDLWVADADGSDARMLLDCSGACRWLDDPDWSPDGNEIVYSRSIQRPDGWGIGTLETVDVVTGRVSVVLGPWKRYFTAGARFSPDGDEVVFEKVQKLGRPHDADIRSVALVVTRLDQPGRPGRRVTDPRLFAATADWSPDGERIVYSALGEPDGEAPDLFWIGPAGGEPTRITSLAADNQYAADPAWLPNGTGVLFSGRLKGAGSPELLSVRIDGSALGPAFGDEVIFGTHPRVQPAP